MSTRGWYEYYVIDESSMSASLAMQFYKCGDATPENAVCELETLRDATRELSQKIPVQLVRDLLDDNVGAAATQLPESFPLGCYYFLLQRAADEVLDPFRDLRYEDLPKEERPDYKLGYALGMAEAERHWHPPRHDDPVISRAHESIAVGKLIRTWRECSTTMNFLRWIQYITQDTTKYEVGALAGYYVKPSDARYVFRFFFRVPALESSDQRVESIDLQACDPGGKTLKGFRAHGSVRSPLAGAGREPVSLQRLSRTHTLVPSPFWEGRLPRNGYLGA